ncbi:MAG: hypothetical protein U0516_02775 [Candidatus Saccharibacteria bacterium]
MDLTTQACQRANLIQLYLLIIYAFLSACIITVLVLAMPNTFLSIIVLTVTPIVTVYVGKTFLSKVHTHYVKKLTDAGHEVA